MNKILVAAATAFVFLWLASWFFSASPEQRSYELMPDMVRSVAYRSQSQNPWLPLGQTDQKPVAGTVPRGWSRLPFGPSEEESLRAGVELVSPLDDQTLDLKRGQAVYEVYCQTCHGAGGQGDGTVTRRGVPAPLPFSAAAARQMRDGQIFHIITFGYKNMPGYAAQVDPRDRWHVVGYVRTLEETQK